MIPSWLVSSRTIQLSKFSVAIHIISTVSHITDKWIHQLTSLKRQHQVASQHVATLYRRRKFEHKHNINTKFRKSKEGNGSQSQTPQTTIQNDNALEY